MGLDMYLRAEKYVSAYSFSSDEEKRLYAAMVEAAGLKDAADPDTPSATISVTVAYWRKANQIHRWFVENVQGGEDECKPYCVGRAQLVALRDLCAATLGERKAAGVAVAEERLPTQSGFFFGGTDYDDWYWADLEDTIAQIDRVLANTPESMDFEYQSSW